jgi:hypothetical protein
MVAQGNRPRVALPPPAADERGHVTSEGEQTPARERHPPYREEVAECQAGTTELDHARRSECPQRVMTATPDADVRRDHDRSPPGEELEMNAAVTAEGSVRAPLGRPGCGSHARRDERRPAADRRGEGRGAALALRRRAATAGRDGDKNKDKSPRSVDGVQPSAAPPVTGLSTRLRVCCESSTRHRTDSFTEARAMVSGRIALRAADRLATTRRVPRESDPRSAWQLRRFGSHARGRAASCRPALPRPALTDRRCGASFAARVRPALGR